MTKMQVAVGLGRKTRAYFCRVGVAAGMAGGCAGLAAPQTGVVIAAGQIRFNNIADEIGDVGCRSFVGGLGHGLGLMLKALF